MPNSLATQMLLDLGRGDESAAARLLPLVYDELHAVAQRCLRRERRDHTLQPTALVNEAYLRLVDRDDVAEADRERFMPIAAQAMRRVLVDHARRRNRAKRGGGIWQRVTLGGAVAPAGHDVVDLVALDDALKRLADQDSRLSQVVELRFFGGLSIDQTARVLGVSDRTVDNDWYVARAWLARELDGEDVS
jgi:RNA polymerase sigma factor (TIGR02999 family)